MVNKLKLDGGPEQTVTGQDEGSLIPWILERFRRWLEEDELGFSVEVAGRA